ncbi:BREX-1 system adenine-specific DNA-methyltransferase PglX [Faecalibacterium sp. PGM34]
MEKAPIKKFAVEARRKLIADVTFQLERYGITEKGIVEPQTSTEKELVFDLGNGNTQTIKGEHYVNQYKNLVAHVRGFYTEDNPKQKLEQFIEEIAFTWFNRLIAIHFMEVNRYIPVRVLSSEIAGQKLPDLVKSPFSGDLEFTDAEKQYIFDLQDANKEDDLFRFVFFKQCNDLSRILPRLFENLEGHGSYSELLVVLSFSDPNGVVYRLVNEVDERWFDIHATDEEGKPMGQVQIIGWMYQYYNTEPKDKVFANLKKNIKISKQNIPAATQLFTPDWIVRYMVENSLGRLWYEGHPGFDKSGWKYYLDEAPQEPQVEQQLKDIRAQYAKMEPEQLKVIDPCMGSGHILCYLFDVLMQIYLDNGYSKREAVRSILENNLFGLDIDKRAAQIAYFSVMMKAREYDSNFFSRSNIPQPRVYDIQESNWLGGAYKHEMGNFLNSQQYRDTLNYLLDAFVDAKEYGSILQIKPLDYEGLKEAWETSAAATAGDINMVMWYDAAKDAVAQLIEQAVMLSQKYDAVVTNPPYMGGSGMNARLVEFIKKNYPDSKSDLFSVMMERSDALARGDGFTSLITMESWMFLSSFEKLRDKINDLKTIVNMVHMPYLGKGGTSLGINFGTAAVVMKKGHIADYSAQYEYTVYYECDDNGVPLVFPTKNERWKTAKQEDFAKIPGSPVAYWVPKQFFNAYDKGKKFGDFSTVSEGVKTGDNNRFLRLWYEVRAIDFSFARNENDKKWYPHHKGGEFRKWYGNRDWVINWKDDGSEIKSAANSGLQGKTMYFQKFASWSKISTKGNPFRIYSQNFLFDSGAPAIQNAKVEITAAFFNSKVGVYFLSVVSPTMNLQVGDVKSVPLLPGESEKIENIVASNMQESQMDWDSFEISWDFKKHPLV